LQEELFTNTRVAARNDFSTPHIFGYARARALESIGTNVLRCGLVLILVLFGTTKFTAAEAAAIKPLVSNSPLMSWLYGVLSDQGASALIGTIEIATAVLIAARPVSARASAVGSALGIGTFVTTLSFLFSTPGALAATHRTSSSSPPRSPPGRRRSGLPPRSRRRTPPSSRSTPPQTRVPGHAREPSFVSWRRAVTADASTQPECGGLQSLIPRGRRGRTMSHSESYDVIIIGSGAGGGTLAQHLARRGSESCSPSAGITSRARRPTGNLAA
jgi:hypothetical protein